MQTYAAEIGEMVRAQRRDEEEIDLLQHRISQVIKELLGQRAWIRFFPYLRAVALIAYYSCTTLAGVQTLGEEYVKIFQIQSEVRAAPLLRARILFIVVHTIAPLISRFALQKAEILLAHPSTSSFLGISIRNNPTARRSFKSLVEWIRSVGIPQLYRIHLAFFYIFGVYYNISRRVSGIKYLSLNPQSDLKALKVYKFLGYLTLTQTALSLILWLVSTLGTERNSLTLKNSGDEKDGDIPHPWFKCSVCLESKSPSTTSCGHLFCWTCIQEHAWSGDGEARCPHCRALFEPSQVVPLLNL
uniref:RING-type E3 ubiquitin transferase n=1 Tax=Haemonchus contortus TaxID=6289 RepID=A0A7I4YBE5_HAECO